MLMESMAYADGEYCMADANGEYGRYCWRARQMMLESMVDAVGDCGRCYERVYVR